MTGYQSKRAAAQDKLTQPAQEPVAHLCKPDKHGLFDFPTPDKACEDCFPVYTAPPHRPWVDLTEEEFEELEYRFARYELCRAIGAALRSKNT